MLKQDSQTAEYYKTGVWGRVTLDSLLRKAVQARADQLALQDPLDRMEWTDGAPKSWTWGQIHQSVEQLSFVMTCWKLPENARIVIQLPNIVELIIAYSACLRANYTPVIVDCIAGVHELRTACVISEASAILTLTRLDTISPATQACKAASRLPNLRYLAAFGDNCPDGVLSLDAILSNPEDYALEAPALRIVASGAENNLAHMCSTIVNDELHIIARNHNHLLATGMMVFLESQADSQETIIAAAPALSAGGIAATLMPWLLSQSVLVLHQPFNSDVLQSHLMEHQNCRLVIPGRQLHAVMSLLRNDSLPQSISCIWSNAAEYVCATQSTPNLVEAIASSITDIVVFNEIAVCAMRRDGLHPKPLSLGHYCAPRNVQGSPIFVSFNVSETKKQGVLALNCTGPTIGHIIDSKNLFDNSTGFIAGINSEQDITNLAPISRVAYVGGLCISLQEIESAFADHVAIDHVHAEIIQDPIFGQRLKINAYPSTSAIKPERLLTLIEKHLLEYGFSSYKTGAEIVIVTSAAAEHEHHEALRSAS